MTAIKVVLIVVLSTVMLGPLGADAKTKVPASQWTVEARKVFAEQCKIMTAKHYVHPEAFCKCFQQIIEYWGQPAWSWRENGLQLYQLRRPIDAKKFNQQFQACKKVGLPLPPPESTI